MEEQTSKTNYPYWSGEMLVNLQEVKELKKVDVKDITQINNLIKSDWIYLTNNGNSILLGRI